MIQAAPEIFPDGRVRIVETGDRPEATIDDQLRVVSSTGNTEAARNAVRSAIGQLLTFSSADILRFADALREANAGNGKAHTEVLAILETLKAQFRIFVLAKPMTKK